MKKLLFVLILIVVSNVVNAKVSCEEAGGFILTGADGKTQYCLSNQDMSWWSAFSWCDAIENASMVDITVECNKKSGNYIQKCPQIMSAKGIPSFSERGDTWSRGWTKNTESNDKAYRLMLNGGTNLSVDVKTAKNGALCVLEY